MFIINHLLLIVINLLSIAFLTLIEWKLLGYIWLCKGPVLTWIQPCLAAPLTYSHQHTKKYKAAFCVVGTGLFPGTGLSPMERVANCNISRLLERRSTGWTGHLCRAGTITKENNARTQLLGWNVSQGAQCTYATDNHFVHGNTKCLLCKLCNCLLWKLLMV